MEHPLSAPSQSDEMARHRNLYTVSRALTYPPESLYVPLVHAERVLDVGCGAGCWLIDMAKRHPHKAYVGLDRDPHVIELARTSALAQGIRNTSFLVADMNALAPHADVFQDGTFGYINAAFLAEAMLCTDYAQLAKTLYRLCSPCGAICWTEAELPLTTSCAFSRLCQLLYKALDAVGHRYGPPSPTQELIEEQRKRLGLPEPERGQLAITPMLHYWLAEAGFTEVREEVHTIDLSSYARANGVFFEQMPLFLRNIKPFLTITSTIDERGFDRLADTAMREIAAEDFCARLYALSVSASKPGQKEEQ